MNLWRRVMAGLRRLASYVVGGWKPDTRVGDEGPWAGLLAGGGPADRLWYEVAQDLVDALEAWRRNFLIRQIVRLTTAYVVGDGVKVSSSHPWVGPFVTAFWSHRQNKIADRLPAWCDELTRAGELFIALFTNPVDGMSYVRAVPAAQIVKVETDPEDYEKETGFVERVAGSVEPKHWKSPAAAGPGEPVLLHYTVNKPVGATRGESDLTPILPWASRYVEWLKERVRANKVRNDLACAEVIIDDDSQVQAKRTQYAADPPTGGGIFVHGKGEELKFPSANIGAYEAKEDGLALRLAIAAGADIPLHFLAEGSSATRTTAAEMGDPTHRHYRMRQVAFSGILADLVEQAYRRRCAALGQRLPAAEDLGLVVECPDVSREDSGALATAAKTVVEAFAVMKANGWITDELAVRLSFKFAGEVLSEEQIRSILDQGVKGEGEKGKVQA